MNSSIWQLSNTLANSRGNAAPRAGCDRMRSWLRVARQTILAPLSAAMLLFAFTPAGAADVYKLGPQDKLRLRVYEWRAPVDQIYEWKAMNGDFVVAASGTISLPLIGEVPAAGHTTSELADTIAKQMAQEIELRLPPKVAVEIAEYRPFYIVGAIAKPGAYPFQPDLTVLRALSIAGGLPRPADLGMMRLGREVITGRGSMQQLVGKMNELLARRARLTGELHQVEKIQFPEELEKLRDNPDVAQILAQEEGIFQARRTALSTQIATLKRLKTYLFSEVGSLEAQVKLKMKEVSTVQQELGDIVTLVKKGLTPSARQFSLERLLAEISSEQLRLETSLLKAKQEISRTDVSIDEAQNKNAIEVASLLRTTEAEIDDTQMKYKTEEKLLYDSEVVFPRLLTSRRQNSEKNEPRYSIVRIVDGTSEELKASETTDVLPGDTIKIELPWPDDLTPLLGGTPRATQ